MIRAAVLLPLMGWLLHDVAPDPVPREGESLAPAKQTQVEMTGEVVTITLAADDLKVKATFQLKNTGSAKEALEVGFPTAAQPAEYKWGDKIDVITWGDATIRDFKASVDGKEVKAQGKNAEYTKEHGIKGWLCWAMEFEAGQSRTVEVSYGMATRDENYTASSPLRNRQGTYILKTGRGWKNAIGSAKVILQFGDLTEEHMTKAAPEPTKKEKTAWTWEWKNWEPDTDILLQYHVYANTKQAAEKLAAFVEKNPEDGAALLDLADNLLELKSHEEAAKVLEKIGALEDKKEWTVQRGRSEWVSPWFRAAEAYVTAGKKEAAKACAEKAAKKIRALLDQIDKGETFAISKFLHTSKEHLLGQLEDCKKWIQ